MESEFQHSKKGTTWAKHKYLRIENGRYIYKDSSGRSSAGTKPAYRFKWMDRYTQEAKDNNAKVFANGVNMYTRKDGTTVITYPGQAAWTVAAGTNLKDLSARLEKMAKTYKMGGVNSDDPNTKKTETEKFLTSLNNCITGSGTIGTGSNGKAKAAVATDDAEQQKQEQPQPQPQQEQPQPQPQQQTSQISQPQQNEQQPQPRQVSGAEAESSKSRLKRIGVRKNKLFEEAQKLSEELAKDPKNEDIKDEINDLYNEIDNYNDEVIEHLTTLKDFGMTNDDIVKYAEEVDIAIDPSSLQPYYLNAKNLEKRNASNIQQSEPKGLFDIYFGKDETDFFEHIGRSKRDGAKVGSGRYPLGSGENPRAGKKLFSFLKKKKDPESKKELEELKKTMSEGKNDNHHSKNNQNNKPYQQNQQKPNGQQNDHQKSNNNQQQNQQPKQNNQNNNDYYKQLSDIQKQYNQQMQMMFQMQQMQMMSNQQQQQEIRQLNMQYQQALNQIQNTRQNENNVKGVVRVSERDWNDIMERVNSNNMEIARLNREKENLRRDYVDTKKKTSGYGKLVIGLGALYFMGKGIKKLAGSNDKDLGPAAEILDDVKNQTKNKAKQMMKEGLQQKTDGIKEDIKEGLKEGSKRTLSEIENTIKDRGYEGLKEGAGEAAKIVTKGLAMVATKRAVDSLTGRDVADAIFKANDKDNVGKFYNNMYYDESSNRYNDNYDKKKNNKYN